MKRHALNQPGDNYTCLMSSIKNILPHSGCGDLRLFTAGGSIALFRWFIFCLLLSFSLLARAATVNITAEFSADISKPQKNEFTNTTETTGFCQENHAYCGDNLFSVLVRGVTGQKYIKANTNDYYNELPSLTIDSSVRKVTLIDKNTNRSLNADFSLTLMAMEYTLNTVITGNITSLTGISTRPILGGCRTAAGITYGQTSRWGWRGPAIPQKVTCRAVSVPLNGAGIQLEALVDISNLSLGYSLILRDSPLNVYSGTYEGEVVYSLGKGKDLDLHALNTPDDDVIIHITATVNHSFNVFFPGGSSDLDVKLDAQGGWSQWINGGRVPESLHREMPFLLTSSTPFIVTMSCGALDQLSQGCALTNMQPGASSVPVEVALTLPGFKHNGADVNQLRLTTATGGVEIDPSGVFIVDRRSRLDFRVSKDYVKEMVNFPGSTWQGWVRLVFDTQAP